jgi:hypothetical protein
VGFGTSPASTLPWSGKLAELRRARREARSIFNGDRFLERYAKNKDGFLDRDELLKAASERPAGDREKGPTPKSPSDKQRPERRRHPCETLLRPPWSAAS